MVSGANASLNYAVERYYKTSATAGTYGTFAGAISGAIPFMVGAKLSSLEKNNNLEVIYGLGNREATNIVEKQFTGSFSIDGVLSDPWVMLPAFGGYAVTGASAPYTHTFTPALTATSIQVANYVELGSTDAKWIYKGCVCTSLSISAAVGEIATCKLDFSYATELFSTTNYVAQITDASEVYTFAHGGLTWNGATIAQVQSVELTVNPNSEMVLGLGSRCAVDGTPKTLEYDINTSIMFLDPATMHRFFYDGTAAGTAPGTVGYTGMVLTFTNGLSGAAQRSIVFTFTNCKINTESLPQSPSELLIDSFTIKGSTCVVTAVNGTATMLTLPA